VAVYSIVDLEKITGVKAHTIRTWEQRYGLINPKRTQTNIRYYLDEDLRQLINISILNKNGHKISRIASMAPGEIEQAAASLSSPGITREGQFDALTLSMMEMDEIKFDNLVNTHIQQLGFERTMLELIYPFLNKLGVIWLTGTVSPAQENFISALIRQKIIAAIDRLGPGESAQMEKILLYLPEGERQELSLLFIHYLLLARHFRVINLGQDISPSDLSTACSLVQPAYVCTVISTAFETQSIQQYVDKLQRQQLPCPVFLLGYPVQGFEFRTNNQVQFVQDLDQLVQLVEGKLEEVG